jgi:hypothetical protein
MSLIRDIQNSAIDSKNDISTLLRQCKVLAARLGSNELGEWADQELNGYNDAKNLPNYRVINTELKGNFSGAFGRALNNAPIPLFCFDKKFRDDLSKTYGTQPISSYEALIKSSSKGNNFIEQIPADLVAYYSQKIYQGMVCLSAWKEIPYGSIVSLVDVVRNKILDFALKIETEIPEAKEIENISKDNASLIQEKVSQVFHTTIYGNVGNIADGNTNVSQSATINVKNGDLKSLKKYLLEYGVEAKEVEELEKAIESDNKEDVVKTKKLGKSVASWIGGLVSKSVNVAMPMAQAVSADLITKAIFMYYGIQ